MRDCIFCKIVAGEIPSEIVAESAHSIAFNDISPKAPLHVLVVSKAHHENIGAIATADPVAAADLAALSRKVADEAGASDYRLIFNSGADAGQTVFHVHGHVLAGGPIALGFE